MIDEEFIPQKISIHENGSIEFSENTRPLRVYADGVFDLFHIGHAKLFKQIKKLLPNCILIAGVVKDEDTFINKGCYPIMNHHERCEIIRSCKFVDEVIVNPPFNPTLQFVNEHKIDVVAHDNLPYPCEEIEDAYKPFKDENRFLPTQREKSVSSTDIVKRILDQHDFLVNNKKYQKK
ncbi:Cytidyltransferase-like domain and Rossmann-like alpha/beta/alpha sandwich fold domain-containing protein [Strongyloides ratti]|uniref:choline-phosphate cytidylyltransferase n=1 Tax=Strongyloides ratti TaxID=34506 RepID=A0A090L940_STRRB|nr:Cytidyltransferase-like domain and Rossmann-like alpha/beta/alpha sandwich fold domain-containing protein [Strongyloides ratti]CEF64045.1 Cytidyltransferase-like domain and Rossmann-like alpha/beta/alpha sandwich fold domain-containing protein [Strongyloides ratti]